MSKEEQKKQFLEWYEEYADDLFRYCIFKTGDRESALEIVQNVFVRLWQTLQKGQDLDNARAFLYASARNSVIDGYRKKKAVSLDALDEAGFEAPSEPGMSETDKIDASRILKIAESLEEKYREVIILRFVNDLSVTEIAELLGEKENNISVRIHRALDQLKKRYVSHDKESEK